MKITVILLSFYGLAVLLGGVMGYATAGSQASLISGLLFGSSLLICAYGMKKQKRAAPYVALLLTFLLDGFFAKRFLKTLSFLPHGLMSLLSLAVLIMLALCLRNIRSSQA